MNFFNFLLIVCALAMSAVAAHVFLGDPGRERAEEKLAAYEERINTVENRAQEKDVKSQFLLAQLYRNGEGRTRNLGLAHSWFKKAAGQGHIGAQYELGRMFEGGEGVKQDYYRAAEWYRLAARLGRHRGAHFALGELYFHGRGVSHDPGASIDWYKKAAEQGHPDAQYVLGTMYRDGWGVTKDLIEAYKWYMLSSRQAGQVSIKSPRRDPVLAIGVLAPQMNSSQLSAAEKAVKSWKVSP